MNVTFEKTGVLEGVITVDIVKDDYADKVTKELKELGKTREIPGFRKGHIDITQLRKRFGKDAKIKVINDLAIDEVLKYIQDNKLDILGRPVPARDHNFNLDDEDVTFKYEIGLAPELNMKLDDTVTLPFYNIAVTDEMINEQDKNMRMQAGEQVKADEYAERALVKGSIMQLNEDGTVKEGGIQVTEGIVAPFLFKNDELAKKFEGTKVGDKVVFNPFDTCDGNEAEVASMLHIERDKVEEARSNFEMTITEFVVNKPAELGQEYYDKVAGKDTVHTEEEYRNFVKGMIEQALQPNSRQLFVRQTEDYLMETYGKVELPEKFLKRFMELSDRNITDENVDAAYREAAPGIKWELIESKAAELMQVKVTEEDVKNFARMFAMDQLRQYGMAQMADQMADYYAENLLKDENQRRRIAHEAFTAKLFGNIHNAVKLDEKTISLDEFRALVSTLNNATGAEVAAAESAE